jgi:hypothetical protein
MTITAVSISVVRINREAIPTAAVSGGRAILTAETAISLNTKLATPILTIMIEAAVTAHHTITIRISEGASVRIISRNKHLRLVMTAQTRSYSRGLIRTCDNVSSTLIMLIDRGHKRDVEPAIDRAARGMTIRTLPWRGLILTHEPALKRCRSRAIVMARPATPVVPVILRIRGAWITSSVVKEPVHRLG